MMTYNRETRPVLAWLDGIKVFVQKEEYARKIHLNCPPNLLRCSLRIRPTTNPEVGKYAILLIPTLHLRPGEHNNTQEDMQGSQLPNQSNNYMNFIIWNCRGAQSPEFRRNFHSPLDYHPPSLVALLETHRVEHQTLKEDFHFTGMAEVAAVGQSGGIAILWHCKIQVVAPTAG
uniref:Uncharacterized protein isoform X2 n=1 Tax=Nicotiana tabacum TaxID=4097 RepID=A0A1S4B5A7_TOBAC|nr:uncharacterized protein LOC104102589 isoform X2 [Nicotiana tomentosiformis]XP_016484051.1 PREDICTED: uncharacterized protein LOC107804638 isoform X2 [Nicotiana tabacum]